MSQELVSKFDRLTKIRIAVDPHECDHPEDLLRNARVQGVSGCYCGLCATPQVPCPHPPHMWRYRNAPGATMPPRCGGCGKTMDA